MTFYRSQFTLDDLELASGIVFGKSRQPQLEQRRPVGAQAVAALEAAILPALRTTPCVVSFSGGRDSSIVLAVATRIARREGLPLPIPATNFFPKGSSANESIWQEHVVRHLHLRDWVRLDSGADLDALGSIATEGLARHGLLWPFNAHFHAPLLEVARGGTLLTGIGGDELLGTSHWASAAAVLSGSRRPRRQDIPRVVVALTPARIRRVALRRRRPEPLPWLTAEAGERFLQAWSRGLANEPLRWSQRWSWWRAQRSVEVGLRSLDLLAADHGASFGHPLTDPGFALAAAETASSLRIFERTGLVRVLFSGLLPPELVERSSKTFFDEVFWGPRSRGFVDEALATLEDIDLPSVDTGALRVAWGAPVPDTHTLLLLQALWLRARQPADEPSNKLAFGTVGNMRSVL